MNPSAYHIEIPHLLLIGIPLMVVLFIFLKWSLEVKTLLYATGRMVLQLIIIGYLLVVVFKYESPYPISAILFVMMAIAAWISLRPLKSLRMKYYFKVLAAIGLGGLPVLLLVVFYVIRLDPWYLPRYLIPMAGMIFANCMNTVSLSAERFISEFSNGKSYGQSRNIAYQAGLIPLMNSFFAVGLVSIPGMMTGQILSGISPLLAVRYQIMVMCMLFGSCGIATAVFLTLIKKDSHHE